MAVIIIITFFALGMALYDYFDSKEWTYVTSPVRNNKVFEERNKKYGAYSIRRDYNVLVLIILSCVFGFVILFKIFTSAFIDRSTVITIAPKYDTTLITLEAPPMQEIKTVKTPYKIEGGGGSGTPDDAPKDLHPKPMVAKPTTPVASTNHQKTGEGNKTTGDNTHNPATAKNPNPFASGSDGSGGGNNGGNGHGFGGDNGNGQGNGNGPGRGGATGRTRIKTPNSDDIISDEDCKVVFSIIVNASGDVISATENRGATTTSNSSLIAKARSLVIRETKYSAKPGAANFTTTITLRFQAH